MSSQSQKIYAIIGIVILSVLVIGGGIIYYYKQKTPPKPVLLHMTSTVTDRDKWISYAFEGELKKTYKAENASGNKRLQTKITKFNGTFDARDEGGINFVWFHKGKNDDKNIKKKIRMDKGEYFFSYKKRGTEEKEVWIEVDGSSGDKFQQIKEIPGGNDLQYMISPEKWVKGAYEMVGLKESSEQEIKDVRLAYKDLFGYYYDYPQKDNSEKEKLRNLYQNNQFLTLTQNYGTESVKGVESYHYGYAVDKTKYRAFWKEWLLGSGDKDYKIPQRSKRTFAWIDKFNEKVETLSGEVWISKKHAYPTQLTVNLTVNDPSVKQISFRITMDGHNTEFPIEEPDSYQTLSEFLKKRRLLPS